MKGAFLLPLLLLASPAGALLDQGRPQFAAAAQDDAPQKWGFYVHAYGEPKATIEQLKAVRKFYKTAPVYIMSDGGMNFTGLCNLIKHCEFRWKPPANDRWNPKPFLSRFREAAMWLGTEYIIYLEPDVEVRHAISREPQHDAGGLPDDNPGVHKEALDYVENLGKTATGNSSFEVRWKHFGLAGGMYIRTAAALSAFDADALDWDTLRKLEMTHRVYSSDLAMAFCLAAKGYTYWPWTDVTQLKYEEHGAKQHKGAAFRHYGREEGRKPFYGAKLSKYEETLVTLKPEGTKDVRCAGCVWEDDCGEECPQTGPTAFLACMDCEMDY